MKQTTVGKVLELYLSTTQVPSRKEQQTLKLDQDGIVGDKFHGKNLTRSVLISSSNSYNIVHNNNIEVSAGALGENILLDCDLSHLQEGDTIQIAEVELEITQNCTVCKGLTKINSKLPKLLKEDRGIFSKVVKEGNIRIGDTVVILKIKNA